MSRLNSLTLTLIDTPEGVVETDIEHYTPPRPPFTPAESLMMHLMHCLQEVSEDENDSHSTPHSLSDPLEAPQEATQADPVGEYRGSSVVAFQKRTDRTKPIFQPEGA